MSASSTLIDLENEHPPQLEEKRVWDNMQKIWIFVMECNSCIVGPQRGLGKENATTKVNSNKDVAN